MTLAIALLALGYVVRRLAHDYIDSSFMALLDVLHVRGSVRRDELQDALSPYQLVAASRAVKYLEERGVRAIAEPLEGVFLLTHAGRALRERMKGGRS